MKRKLLSLFAVSALLASCVSGQNEDIVKSPEKSEASVETKISITHLGDKFDIMKTESKIWNKKQLIKRIVKIDTLPGLGTTSEIAENEDGEDSAIVVPKNYQLFITVK